jgi:opacity protein-like surface antigen
MIRLLLPVSFLILVSAASLAQEKVGIGLWGGLAIPTGHYGDIYDTGYGFAGSFEYRLNPGLGFTVSAGIFRWSVTETVPDEIGLGFEEEYTSSLSTVPLLGGIRYYILPRNFSPYVHIEIGTHFVKWEETFLEETVTGSGSDYGFGLGAGTLIYLSPTFQVDAQIKYNSINTENKSIIFISTMIGMRYAF